MKKIISLTTAMILTFAFALPTFAASPTTEMVNTTPVTVPASVTAAKGYILTPQEQALVATSLEEALALAAGVLAEADGGIPVANTAAAPALIAMAKADILKDAAVKRALASYKAAGIIVNSGTLAAADGRAAKKTISLTAAGLVPGQKVVILYYLPGEVTPRIARPVWKNGKLRVTVPLPCVYNIVK